jgi:hypothetical protein
MPISRIVVAVPNATVVPTTEVKKQAIMPGYHAHVWYNKKAITNILSLSNMIKQYRVTYDSNDQMFVVHREPE